MKQKKQTDPLSHDLQQHGVKDIIPKGEEYYTLKLQRDFDDRKRDDHALGGFSIVDGEEVDADLKEASDTDLVDIASADPTDVVDIDDPQSTTSLYEGTQILDRDIKKLESSNQGGTLRQAYIIDENSEAHVGNPGHGGSDDGTG